MADALKWIGYILAAMVVLAVAAGFGLALTIVGAFICLVAVVLFVASMIKWLVTPRSR